MGLLDGLMGNASELDIEELASEFEPILANDEEIELGFKLIRDMFIFTNKRMLIVDKQGLTGKKVLYHSVPFKSISHFALESAGHFDMDAELKLWISGTEKPISYELKRGSDVVAIQKTLANCIL
ncbi:PH domain-containing protein [Psychrobium sp. 1_MG-2023]|uniref:PH domain-containing protein n=1 Tax=Psychrobium sp. 1_MG-2023 TaxID=3062624 RepID=UPI000C34DC22|nr:PH domain-containing protein [Psychrobium sp. 1_MG-2023]MDP2562059.1 PH domain-containing protein [Psychrobium sp. 1_MG-2023]PKF58546.1 helicase [Alteromonadales bacterium alter-6D02]